jgi:hypothetical protein
MYYNIDCGLLDFVCSSLSQGVCEIIFTKKVFVIWIHALEKDSQAHTRPPKKFKDNWPQGAPNF